jgi:hypothetical protein
MQAPDGWRKSQRRCTKHTSALIFATPWLKPRLQKFGLFATHTIKISNFKADLIRLLGVPKQKPSAYCATATTASFRL